MITSTTLLRSIILIFISWATACHSTPLHVGTPSITFKISPPDTFELKEDITTLLPHATDTNLVFTGDNSAQVTLFDVVQQKVVLQDKHHRYPILHLACSKKGKHYFGVDQESRLVMKAYEKQQVVKSILTDISCQDGLADMYQVTLSSNEQWIATPCIGGILLFDVQDMEEKAFFELPEMHYDQAQAEDEDIGALIFEDNEHLLMVNVVGSIFRYHIKKKQCEVLCKKTYSHSFPSLHTFSPNAYYLAVTGPENSIMLRYSHTGNTFCCLQVPQEQQKTANFTRIAWHPHGHFLAATSSNGRLYIWDIEKKTLVHVIEKTGITEAYNICLTWNHNGTKIIATQKRSIQVWDIMQQVNMPDDEPITKDDEWEML